MMHSVERRVERQPVLNDLSQRGLVSEAHFMEAWSDPKTYPSWLIGVRRATGYEDHHEKTDAVMITTSGIVPIQIKVGAISNTRKMRYRRTGIVILRIRPGEPPASIRMITLQGLIPFLRLVRKNKIVLQQPSQKL